MTDPVLCTATYPCHVLTTHARCSCHHLYYLLDKNQSGLIPPSVLAYHMKMRVYYQPYDPARHQQLYRWHWQTAMGSGEYDVPKCAAGTPPDQCVHKITANIRVSDFANGACDPRSGLNVLTPACKNGSIGFKPIFLGGHCHAPTVRQNMFQKRVFL